MKDVSVLSRLCDWFDLGALSWRAQRGGIGGDGRPWVAVIPYVTARDAAERFDEVFGPIGWQTKYRSIAVEDAKTKEGGIVCSIGCRVGDGEWIWKEDVSPCSREANDGGERIAIKGGFSGAFKRAAAVWGVGRYLYLWPDFFATIVDHRGPGVQQHKHKQDGRTTTIYWLPPDMDRIARKLRESGIDCDRFMSGQQQQQKPPQQQQKPPQQQGQQQQRPPQPQQSPQPQQPQQVGGKNPSERGPAVVAGYLQALTGLATKFKMDPQKVIVLGEQTVHELFPVGTKPEDLTRGDLRLVYDRLLLDLKEHADEMHEAARRSKPKDDGDSLLDIPPSSEPPPPEPTSPSQDELPGDDPPWG